MANRYRYWKTGKRVARRIPRPFYAKRENSQAIILIYKVSSVKNLKELEKNGNMNFISESKEIDIDLNSFTLCDLVTVLEKERFFENSEYYSLQEKINENLVIFNTPRTRATPGEIWEFEYFEEEKKIKISGRYKSKWFPVFLMYAMPLVVLFLKKDPYSESELNTMVLIFAGITLYCVIITFLGIKGGSQEIERELFIRLNHLLRQKGIKGKL